MIKDQAFDIITFDCYGTLIDWEAGISSAFQHEASKDGLTLDRMAIIDAYMAAEPVVESNYRTYREVQVECVIAVAKKLNWSINADRTHFLTDSLPQWQPFADTNDALERLKSRYQLGILSNIDNDLLAATRRHFTVEFDLIITAQELKSYKPGHAHFNTAQERLAGKRLLHAAQSHFHDVIPCRALGIPVVWVNRNHETLHEGDVHPDAEVRNLAGLAELMGV